MLHPMPFQRAWTETATYGTSLAVLSSVLRMLVGSSLIGDINATKQTLGQLSSSASGDEAATKLEVAGLGVESPFLNCVVWSSQEITTLLAKLEACDEEEQEAIQQIQEMWACQVPHFVYFGANPADRGI